MVRAAGRSGRAVAAVLAAAAAVSSYAGPPPITQESRLALTLRPLAVEGDATRALPPGGLEVARDRSALTEIAVAWPGETTTRVLEVRARDWSEEGPAGEHVVLLETSLPSTDGTVQRASRKIRLHEDVESLVEILAMGERHLILAVKAEKVDRPVLRRAAKPGIPVRFAVTVYRIRDGEAYPLEDNDLRTLVGENVSYEFSLGGGDLLETLRLDLLPARISGELLEIEVHLRGSLRTLESPLYVERSERWMTSRGAASRMDAASGEPPNGYRFQVVPLF